MQNAAQNKAPEAILPTPPDALLAHLDAMGIPYTLHHHAPIFTAAEGEHLKTVIPGAHCKNLFVRDKKQNMCLITLPDDVKPDLKALSCALGMGRMSFGSPERLWTYLGVQPGSVCPYAVMNDTQGLVSFVLDKRLADANAIIAHPMRNTMSISVTPADLIRFAAHHNHPPHIIDLAPFCAPSLA